MFLFKRKKEINIVLSIVFALLFWHFNCLGEFSISEYITYYYNLSVNISAIVMAIYLAILTILFYFNFKKITRLIAKIGYIFIPVALIVLGAIASTSLFESLDFLFVVLYSIIWVIYLWMNKWPQKDEEFVGITNKGILVELKQAKQLVKSKEITNEQYAEFKSILLDNEKEEINVSSKKNILNIFNSSKALVNIALVLTALVILCGCFGDSYFLDNTGLICVAVGFIVLILISFINIKVLNKKINTVLLNLIAFIVLIVGSELITDSQVIHNYFSERIIVYFVPYFLLLIYFLNIKLENVINSKIMNKVLVSTLLLIGGASLTYFSGGLYFLQEQFLLTYLIIIYIVLMLYVNEYRPRMSKIVFWFVNVLVLLELVNYGINWIDEIAILIETNADIYSVLSSITEVVYSVSTLSIFIVIPSYIRVIGIKRNIANKKEVISKRVTKEHNKIAYAIKFVAWIALFSAITILYSFIAKIAFSLLVCIANSTLIPLEEAILELFTEELIISVVSCCVSFIFIYAFAEIIQILHDIRAKLYEKTRN